MTAHKRFHGRTTLKNDGHKKEHIDGVGNKKGFCEVMIPPDDVGNLAQEELHIKVLEDDLGNNAEGDPAHLQSGILAGILGGSKISSRKSNSLKQKPLGRREHISNIFPESARGVKNIESNAEGYIHDLRKDFLRLLSLREGKPFSFFVKPAKDDSDIFDEALDLKLIELKAMITSLVLAKVARANVEVSKYTTGREHFIVFFVEPSGDDPIVNKYLIAALRQVVDNHVKRQFDGYFLNLFVVLASAKEVMEAHLEKLGAKKV